MDVVKSMNVESTMRSAFLFLMDLAWKSRLRIPFILTVGMMALDFRLQLDINISVTQRRRRRSQTQNSDNDDQNEEENDIVVVQINQRYMRRAAQGVEQLPSPEGYDDIGDDDDDDSLDYDDSIMGGYLTDSDYSLNSDSFDASDLHGLDSSSSENENNVDDLEGASSPSSRLVQARVERVNNCSVCGLEVEDSLDNTPIMRLLNCNCSDDNGSNTESDIEE